MENNNEQNVPQTNEQNVQTQVENNESNVQNQVENNESNVQTQEENNEPDVIVVSNSNENVVTPVVDKRDFADKAIDTVETFMDTKNHSSEFTPEEVNKYKNNALVCYFPFASLYFILNGSTKKSEYLKFHANQGLDITILLVLVYFGSKVLCSIFKEDSLLLNTTPGWLEVAISIMYFICILYMLFGVINTVNGLSKELQGIGKIKLIK